MIFNCELRVACWSIWIYQESWGIPITTSKHNSHNAGSMRMYAPYMAKLTINQNTSGIQLWWCSDVPTWLHCTMSRWTIRLIQHQRRINSCWFGEWPERNWKKVEKKGAASPHGARSDYKHINRRLGGNSMGSAGRLPSRTIALPMGAVGVAFKGHRKKPAMSPTTAARPASPLAKENSHWHETAPEKYLLWSTALVSQGKFVVLSKWVKSFFQTDGNLSVFSSYALGISRQKHARCLHT